MKAPVGLVKEVVGEATKRKVLTELAEESLVVVFEVQDEAVVEEEELAVEVIHTLFGTIRIVLYEKVYSLGCQSDFLQLAEEAPGLSFTIRSVGFLRWLCGTAGAPLL